MTDPDVVERVRRNQREYVRRFLERGRELYEAGDKEELLYCLDYCLKVREPIPTWLGRAFRNAYAAIRMHNVGKWDDVFGKPIKKGKRLATERRNVKDMLPLFWRIRERNAAGELIDGLFHDVGKDFGLSGSVAKELYYRASKLFAMTPDDIINRGY